MVALMLIAVFLQLSDKPLTGEQRRALQEAQEDIKSGDPDRIYEAASRLIRMRHRQAIIALTDAFKSGDKMLRLKIAKALADRSSYLSEAVSGYSALLEAASTCKEKAVLEQIERALVSARRPDRAHVSAFLARLAAHSPAAAPLIAAVFQRLPLDNWREVGNAISAANALWPSDDAKKILSAVNRALVKNFRTPQEAALWFEKNKNRSFRDVLGEIRKTVDKMRHLILKHIHDKIALISKIPAEVREKECVARLTDQEEATEVKVFALKELGRLKAKRHADTVAQFLKSDDERLRVAAAWALSHMGADRFAPKIAELLKSESEQERLAAVKSLMRLESAPSETLCEALKKEKSEAVLKALLEAVAVLRPAEAAGVIVKKFFVRSGDKLILREKGEVGRAVARALAAVAPGGGKPVLLALLALTENADAAIRYAGCEGLGAVGGDLARSRLAEIADRDKEPGVRAAAIRALVRTAQLGEKEMDVLLAALAAEEKEVSEAALDGLRRVTGVAGNHKIDMERLADVVARLLKQKRYDAMIRLLDVPQSRIAKMTDKEKKRFGELLLLLADEHARRKALMKAVETCRRALTLVGSAREGEVRLKIATLLERQAKFAEAYEELKKAQSLLPPEQAESIFIRRLSLIKRIATEKRDVNSAAALLKECCEQAKRLKLSEPALKRLETLKKSLLGG